MRARALLLCNLMLMLALTAVFAVTADAKGSGGASSSGGAQASPYVGPGTKGAARFGHRRGHRRGRGHRAHRGAPAGPGASADATTSVSDGPRAQIVDGLAQPPAGAPPAVAAAISAGNKLIGKPYRYGGGHGSFEDSGYDCSGAVSYALHGGQLLSSPLDSSSFESWGEAGAGQWITVYTNPGHAYVNIAGIRLDTSAAEDSTDAGSGARWRPVRSSNSGFQARHPTGF